MRSKFEMLMKVDFGDIDGMYDPNLNDYFVDRNYWEEIITNGKYYVIGRKGTGKSALYKWIKMKTYESGDLCSNMLFNEFPFGQLLTLRDDTFLKPNQYQTICKNMILNEFARLIVSDAEHDEGKEYKEIEYYYKNVIGESIQDCFRESVKRTNKKEGQLVFNCLSLGRGTEIENTYSFINNDLISINNYLEKVILEYFKAYPYKKKFLIQVDGIDENYTQLVSEQNELSDYFQFIICLMKATYTFNQKVHSECSDIAKCIIYLRSDIFFEIHKKDSESARWEQNAFFLNWAIGREDSWHNNDLRKIVNARICNSISEIKNVDAFDYLFIPKDINLKIPNGYQNKKRVFRDVDDLFEYIVIRTFHRPRDVIQFCTKLKEAAKKIGELDFRTFKQAEREYSLWFLSEITNEISPNIKNVDSLFTMLRSVGSKPMTISRFKEAYAKYESEIGFDVDDLLKYLYELAIIYNINDKGEVFSAIRNDRSRLNPDIKIRLHPGFWGGLYVSTF